jgi:hypothetical protein
MDIFGFVAPILTDSKKRIVAGHGRYLAAQLSGRDIVPVIQLDHLTDEQAKAFRIADNRLTEASSWDERLLAETLKELAEVELDFSIEATGFTIGEIDVRIEGLSATADGESDLADHLPTPTGLPATGKSGDLWHLGGHSLLCGNALSPDSFRTLLEDRSANMVFTDPPYNVPISGHASGKGRIQHRNFAMAIGELNEIEFTSFLTRCCALMAKHSVDGSIHFVCMDWRHASEMLEAGRLAYTDFKNICVWVKDNGGMGSLYRSRHELIFAFKHGSSAHRNNVELGRHGRNRTNVWQYPCANTFSRQSDEGHLAALHPTVTRAISRR